MMDKVCIITGASSGIGRAAAYALAERGVSSILTYDSNQQGADETVTGVMSRGRRAAALRLDMGDSRSFPSFYDKCASILEEWACSKFHYLVNNAGFGKMSLFEDTSEELFDSFHRVLVRGPFFLTQTLLPILSEGGSIVNIASNSMLPLGMETGYSAYATAKGGLVTLTAYLARELSKRKITVNAVSPGATRTRIADDAFEKYPEVIPEIAQKTALGRIGEAKDIGDAVAAILSDDFRWMTGQNVEISGGYRMV